MVGTDRLYPLLAQGTLLGDRFLPNKAVKAMEWFVRPGHEYRVKVTRNWIVEHVKRNTGFVA